MKTMMKRGVAIALVVGVAGLLAGCGDKAPAKIGGMRMAFLTQNQINHSKRPAVFFFKKDNYYTTAVRGRAGHRSPNTGTYTYLRKSETSAVLNMHQMRGKYAGLSLRMRLSFTKGNRGNFVARIPGKGNKPQMGIFVLKKAGKKK